MNNVLGHYQRRTDVKVYLEIFLSLATVSLFAVFALRPTLLTIAELIKQIEARKEVVIKMNEKISNLTRAQLLYDQERKRLLLLQEAIPKEPEPEVLIRQLEGLSSKNSVNVEAFSLESAVILGSSNQLQKETPQKPVGGTNELTFTSSATSKYPFLLSFISDIEKMRRPTTIRSLSFSVKEEGDGKTIILSIQGSMPFAKDLTNTEKK